MDNTEVLHSNQEFFTVVATGESGISIRGLSRLTGIAKSTLARWFDNDLSHDGLPKHLKPLQGKALYLSHLVHEIKVRGKAIKPIRAEIAAEIIFYAAIELGKDAAKQALRDTASIGLTSYIQGKTGFLDEKFAKSTTRQRDAIDNLVFSANPWEALYSQEMCDRVRSWYFPRNFFWTFCYNWMTSEEIKFLDECNPVIEGRWQRKNRIFQHLSQATRDRLEPQIRDLCVLLVSSTSRQDFETRYKRANGYNQQEIFQC
jgi:hypothetical protein